MTNLAEPVSRDPVWGSIQGTVSDQTDLTTYLAATYLPLAGGTLEGDLDMGGNNISNVSISADSVAVGGLAVATTQYVDDEVSANGESLQAFASNASNLTSGTVADARLSANVARRDQANTLTQALTVSANISLSGDVILTTHGRRFRSLADGIGAQQTSDGNWAGITASTFQTRPATSTTERRLCIDDRIIYLTSTGGVQWRNSLTEAVGAADASIVRNATGPTLESRAAGGLKVANADGSAVAAVQCSTITSTQVSVAGAIRSSDANGLLLATDGSYAAGFRIQCLGSNGKARFGNFAGTGFQIDTNTADTLTLRNAADSAGGNLAVANLTASGNVQGTFRPTQFTVATLPSAAANTGRTVQVTDSSVDFPGNIGNTVAGGGANNVDVKSNGTNWRITG